MECVECNGRVILIVRQSVVELMS